MGESRDAAAGAFAGTDVAIVGMAGVFPGARNLQEFWENIVAGVDAISDPPPDWAAERYGPPDPKIYCARGGYLGELARFDPTEHGVMPGSVDGGEPDQFLALRAAKEALTDADVRPGATDARIAIFLGRGTYANRGGSTLLHQTVVVDQVIGILEQLHPEHTREELDAIRQDLVRNLPPFNTDTAPALVPNLITGRIANRLGLTGANFLVDAACASSLIAVDLGIRELTSGRCDVAIAGGVHASNPPPILRLFCELGAISPAGAIRPFDGSADGTLLGEGVGIVVLKRRADAERERDRIYAVVKAVGTASDGKGAGLLAPRAEGQELALRRAYESAGVSPETVELIEGHGTGTKVGDAAELEALERLFGPRDGELPTVALGTVKSMIGHLVPASGVAGLIKTALALHHKVLPPTLGCESPNARLDAARSRLYINGVARPWIHGRDDVPRRAGVSAFGFGGANAHAILEEYPLDPDTSLLHRWDSEVFIFAGESRDELVAEAHRVWEFTRRTPDVVLKDLAFTLNARPDLPPVRLAIVARSVEDLGKKLARAIERLKDSRTQRIRDVEGIYFAAAPLGREGRLGVVFPGEGSQYPYMLADLCLHFPEVRRAFDFMDRVFLQHRRGYRSSDVIFPPSVSAGSTDRRTDPGRLWDMDAGAEAVFTANEALAALSRALGIVPDAMVGHSMGEHSALLAGGVVRWPDDAALREHILRIYGIFERLNTDGSIPEAALVAAGGVDRRLLQTMVDGSNGDLHVAMDNCPNQVVLCAPPAVMAEAVAALQQHRAICQTLPFARAYHTPHFEVFCRPLGEYFRSVPISRPSVDMYSCLTADRYPDDPEQVRWLVSMQWARAVRFRETVEAMYRDGVRVFLELGPRGNLTSFIGDTLRGRPVAAIAANVLHHSGLTQLNHMVGQLIVHGVAVNVAHLYERRAPVRVDVAAGTAAMTASGRSTEMRIPSALQSLRLSPDFVLPKRPAPVPDALPVVPSLSTGRVPLQEAAPRIAEAPEPRDAAPAGPRPARALEPQTQTPRPLAVSPAVSPEAGAAPGRTLVLQEHLRTMETFLQMQQQVMGAYLARRSAVPAPSAPSTPGRSSRPPGTTSGMPLVGQVKFLEERLRAVVVRTLDLSEDLLLRDHTFGRDLSVSDPSLDGLSVVPLTLSMEMLAEAAALVRPGSVVTGMREVRAYKWLMLPKPLTLEVTAQAADRETSDVEVAIREVDAATGKIGPIVVEGTVLVGSAYPEAPRAERFDIRGERPTRWSTPRLYTEGMFHGPAFQGVSSVDRSGEDGLVATLSTLPTDRLFRSFPHPELQTDAVLLDAAGQAVGFWAREHLPGGFDLFPYRLAALHLYRPPASAGERVACRVRVRSVDEKAVVSDFDLVDAGGEVWCRFVGWEDRRFDFPARFLRLQFDPRGTFLSLPWQAPLGAGRDRHVACCRVDHIPATFLSAHGGVWLGALAHLVLSRRERTVWDGMQAGTKRRIDWLLGRVAAKDAIRLLLRSRLGLVVCPADVEILADEHGRPLVGGTWTRGDGSLAVSIAHSDGVAAALAALNTTGSVGLDLERLEPARDGFEDLAFTADERRLLDAVEAAARREWYLRMWCAKEAAGKAWGRGLDGGPHGVSIRSLDVRSGCVTVEARPATGTATTRRGTVVVQTVRDEGYVAGALWEAEEYGHETGAGGNSGLRTDIAAGTGA